MGTGLKDLGGGALQPQQCMRADAQRRGAPAVAAPRDWKGGLVGEPVSWPFIPPVDVIRRGARAPFNVVPDHMDAERTTRPCGRGIARLGIAGDGGIYLFEGK